MAVFEDHTFARGERVKLSGNHYKCCVFDGAILEFDGTAGVTFEECDTRGIQWQITGPAATTIEFLQALDILDPGAVRQLFGRDFIIPDG